MSSEQQTMTVDKSLWSVSCHPYWHHLLKYVCTECGEQNFTDDYQIKVVDGELELEYVGIHYPYCLSCDSEKELIEKSKYVSQNEQ